MKLKTTPPTKEDNAKMWELINEKIRERFEQQGKTLSVRGLVQDELDLKYHSYKWHENSKDKKLPPPHILYPVLFALDLWVEYSAFAKKHYSPKR